MLLSKSRSLSTHTSEEMVTPLENILRRCGTDSAMRCGTPRRAPLTWDLEEELLVGTKRIEFSKEMHSFQERWDSSLGSIGTLHEQHSDQ